MRGLRAAWRRHPVLLGGFVAALALVAFFAIRLVMFTVYWSDPMHRDQTPEAWMTPGYVEKSWDVAPGMLRDVIGPAGKPGQHLTLDRIAAERGETLEALIARIEAAIAVERADPQ